MKTQHHECRTRCLSPWSVPLQSFWSVPLLSSWSVAIGSRALLIALVFLLASCGDDSTQNITQVTQSMDVIADVSKLPKCEKSNDGEQVWVKNEMTPRMCSDGKWYAVAEGSVAATCSTKQLKDSSGLKIICGGDSIGVVLNGKDGADGKDGKDGKDGATGIQGKKGATGDQGLQGVQGKKGEKGETGDSGMQGVQGKKGEKGDVGSQGAQGKKGETGDAGADGKDGAAGKNGTDGKDGSAGANGKDGTDGADGKGCSMETIDEYSVRVICGSDSTILYVDSNVFDTTLHDNPVVLDSEKIAISLNQVSGVTQKGPFLSGSKVLVRELEDGRTLTQTGNSFNGKILNDKGEFKINARMLVSQYVMLEVTGYYRNEVTGKNSNSELTLFAITDVNDRNTVNVNLLTHLEYERVIYLVTQKKMKVRAAKKQAQKEVFAILNIDATNFENSEDLNIVGNTEADAALLAFSVVLQANRSVSELSELLQKIALDIEKDGTLDDPQIRKSLADWAAQRNHYCQENEMWWDSKSPCVDTLSFEWIGRNVQKWGLTDTVPNFMKYVYSFWSKEYGLGTCNKENYNKIAVATASSAKGKIFLCSYMWMYKSPNNISYEDNEIYEYYGWVKSTDEEKNDTYNWNDTIDGAVRYGDYSGKMYVFDSMQALSIYSQSGWRLVDYLEEKIGKCTQSRLGEYRYQDVEITSDKDTVTRRDNYICIKAETASGRAFYTWESVSDSIEKWPAAEDGSARWGDLIIQVAPVEKRYCYVYDADGKGWRMANNEDCSLKMGGCTKRRSNEIVRTSDGVYYQCAYDSSGYKKAYWNKLLVSSITLNTMGWVCLDSNDGEVRKGQFWDSYFVCEDSVWRDAATKEERDCILNGVCQVHNCTSKKNGRFENRDGVQYVYENKRPWDSGWFGVWREANCAEIRMRSLCLIANDTIVWNCEKYGNFMIDYACGTYYKDNFITGWHPVEGIYDYSQEAWNEKKKSYYTSENNPDAVYGKDLVDSRDGNVYKTVIIDGKRWMAQNLRFSDSTQVNFYWNSGCGNDEWCETTGRYYSWTTAMGLDSKWSEGLASSLPNFNRRGICPEGWHVPDTTEWMGLIRNVSFEAQQMKGFSGWPNATDASGFSLIPDKTYFWSSTESSSNKTYGVRDGTVLDEYEKTGGYYIRCIEDDKE